MFFFTPAQTAIMIAAAAGSFLALLVTRKAGFLHVLTLFAVGELTAIYFSDLAGALLHLTTDKVAFLIGALGMLIWGGILNLAQKVHDDPLGTISWAWGLWRGRTNADRSDNDR